MILLYTLLAPKHFWFELDLCSIISTLPYVINLHTSIHSIYIYIPHTCDTPQYLWSTSFFILYRDHVTRWVYGQKLTKSSVSDSIGCMGIHRTVNLLLDPSGVETWLILSYILV